MMSLTADLTGKPPNQVDEHRQCSVGDHRGMAVARVEAQTEAVALQLGRYRHNIRWWASSPSHERCACPLSTSIPTDILRTTITRSQCCSCRRTSGQWTVGSELETLMAVAVAVTNTRTATARTMAVYEQAWAGEQELWMACSNMTAPLACESTVAGPQGT